MTRGRGIARTAALCAVVLASAAGQVVGAEPVRADTPVSTQGVTADEVRIGYMGALSGQFASYGLPVYQAFKMEVDEINRAGGINGRTIVIVPRDDECNADRATQLEQDMLAQDDVLMQFVHTCSGVAQAARTVVQGSAIPVVVSSAVGPDPQGSNANMFYVTLAGPRQAKGLAAYAANALAASRVAILSSDDAYGQSAAVAVGEYMDGHGLDLVAQERSAANATNISAQVQRIVDAKPDAVILATYGNIAKQYLEAVAGLGLDVPTLGMSIADGAIDQVSDPAMLSKFYSNTPFAEVPGGPAWAPYATRFRETYPEYVDRPVPSTAFIGLTDAGLLRLALSQVGAEVTRSAVIDRMSRIQGWAPEAPTLACPLDFTRPGHEGETCATLYRVDPDRTRVAIRSIDGAPAATQTSATVPATSSYGQAFDVRVTVVGPSTAGGAVTVADGATVLASTLVDADGVVDIPIRGLVLAPGIHTLTVTFGGTLDAHLSRGNVNIKIVPARSTTKRRLAVARMKDASVPKIVARVFAPGVPSAALTGSFKVYDGKRFIKKVRLTAVMRGKRIITLPPRRSGVHRIKVVYSGNALVAASASRVLRVVVP